MKDEIKEIIQRNLGLSSMPAPEATFANLGADSLDLVEILIDCEESFGIELGVESVRSIKTVQHLIDALESATKSSVDSPIMYPHEGGIETIED